METWHATEVTGHLHFVVVFLRMLGEGEGEGEGEGVRGVRGVRVS